MFNYDITTFIYFLLTIKLFILGYYIIIIIIIIQNILNINKGF